MSDKPRRELPGHILRALTEGKIDGYEAQRRADEYFKHAEANGGDMNDRLRAALFGRVAIGRARHEQAVRDAKGRFAKQGDDEPDKPDMNALIRMHARGVPAPQGTLNASDVTEPPGDAA